jgi:hypothetical protein
MAQHHRIKSIAQFLPLYQNPEILGGYDSSVYSYPNSHVGGGLEQSFDITNYKRNKYSEIKFYGSQFLLPNIRLYSVFNLSINSKNVQFTSLFDAAGNGLLRLYGDTIYIFNSQNQLVQADIRYANLNADPNEDPSNYKMLFTYNSAGNRITDSTFILPANKTQFKILNYNTYEYNVNNLLQRITKYKSNGQAQYVTEYEYDSAQRYTEIRYFNGSLLSNRKLYSYIKNDTLEETTEVTVDPTIEISKIIQRKKVNMLESITLQNILGTWDSTYREVFCLDENKLPTQSFIYQKVTSPDTTKFDLFNKTIITYDSNRLLIHLYSEQYYFKLNRFIPNRDIRYYWERYLPSDDPTEEQNENIMVAPNPFQNTMQLTFELPNQELCNVQIVSSDGKIVQNMQFKGMVGINNVDLSSHALHPGIYLVFIQQGNYKASTKALKLY